mmetsp:Transcript_19413/g.33228  ORF Transcript_19413/g.33228 Transcript_19413/m.33228 type:complete len:105 (+) Transcript_19413:480-794(+)
MVPIHYQRNGQKHCGRSHTRRMHHFLYRCPYPIFYQPTTTSTTPTITPTITITTSGSNNNISNNDTALLQEFNDTSITRTVNINDKILMEGRKRTDMKKRMFAR